MVRGCVACQNGAHALTGPNHHRAWGCCETHDRAAVKELGLPEPEKAYYDLKSGRYDVVAVERGPFQRGTYALKARAEEGQ